MALPFHVHDADARDRLFRRDLWDALRALRMDSRPRWGGMTAQQMVEHLAWIFDVSTGRASVECLVPEAKRERYKSFLHDDARMMREFRNPILAAGLPPLRHPGLPQAIDALRTSVGRFVDGPPAADHAATHPVFGPLTAEEWSRNHFKHVFHHLEQFGLVDDETDP